VGKHLPQNSKQLLPAKEEWFIYRTKGVGCGQDNFDVAVCKKHSTTEGTNAFTQETGK